MTSLLLERSLRRQRYSAILVLGETQNKIYTINRRARQIQKSNEGRGYARH